MADDTLEALEDGRPTRSADIFLSRAHFNVHAPAASGSSTEVIAIYERLGELQVELAERSRGVGASRVHEVNVVLSSTRASDSPVATARR